MPKITICKGKPQKEVFLYFEITNIFSIFNSMNNLYFIAILPDQALSAMIDGIRKECALDHGVYAALKPPVHITLAPPFKLPSGMEFQLSESLKTACNFTPFVQKLENFDGFPEHTIYIQAKKSSALTTVYNNLKSVLKLYNAAPKGQLTPHITIAYRDVKEAYSDIMQQYKKRKLKAEFLVNHFTLLKHNGKYWDVLKDYYSSPGSEQLTMSL
nr:2'-5' RNA ligase family protein [Pedobacter sp. ASV19]